MIAMKMKFRRIAELSLLACCFVALLALTNASAQPPIVDQIRIERNQRVESDAILFHVTQEKDEPLDEDAVKNDIRSISRMGFFDRVTADVVTIKGEQVLVYTVSERPQIVEVRIDGMEALSRTDPRVVQSIKVHEGAILNPDAVQDTIKNLTSVYQDEGYIDAKITFTAVPQPNNTTIALFKVIETPK